MEDQKYEESQEAQEIQETQETQQPKSKKTKLKKKKQTKSEKSGLVIPMATVRKQMRQLAANKYRVTPCAAVYAGAVLQYVTREILSLASEMSHVRNAKYIMPSHLRFVIKNDTELNDVFGGLEGAGAFRPYWRYADSLATSPTKATEPGEPDEPTEQASEARE